MILIMDNIIKIGLYRFDEKRFSTIIPQNASWKVIIPILRRLTILYPTLKTS